uniref:EGF-like domain-containing protein n=1 Tax=Timema genevievae TaxID=629358 RepID=A0A7R9K0V0_TIMGE|nr:unnamed protein product [Timema genevievae]
MIGYVKFELPDKDIDECFEKIHVCNLASEACINEPGGYRCGAKSGQDKQPTTETQKCPPGFREHPVTKSCVDIDECTENEESPCDSNQDCTNTQGGYTCSCKYGFLLDQTLQACIDVNECQVNSHNCLPTQRCDNTIGSFQCIRFTSCGTGYTLNAETGDCEDDNECQLGSDNCQALGPIWVCRNTPGSFRCERKLCGPKQTLLPSGDCKNAECSVGFESNEQGQCKDINECQLPTTCQRNQRCFNTIGSYRCINLINCGGGYVLNTEGTQCVDIDECAQGTHDCGRGQICQNRQGGYLCQCPTGYTTNHLKECVDIDECTRYAGQILMNVRIAQEYVIRPVLIIGGHTGVVATLGTHCNMIIDECEQFKERNLCVGICVNQPGSYSCKCPDGYRLGSDGRTCQDEDECLAGNVCDHPDDVCINTRGGYRCNTISCPSNFVKETEHKNRCRRISSICREGDTNCLNTPGSYSFNFITFVSNLAIPPVGQLDLFTMRGPLWSTTTVSFTLDMLDSRAPIGIERATKEHFRLRRTSHNQAVISLIKKITGPQEIELQLTMKMYHSASLGGSAVARLFIYVSQYEF